MTRELGEFTLDFSGDFKIAVGLDLEGGEIFSSPTKEYIRLIDQNMLLCGEDEFYITCEQLLEVIQKGRPSNVELCVLDLFGRNEFMRMKPQQAMSIMCKWMNYHIKHREVV